MASSQTFDRKHVSRLVPADHRVLMPLLLAVTIVNSATLGYDSSVMNGLLILPVYSEYFKLNTATEGLNNAAMWMGGIFGAFLMQPVPDYFGRRRAIYIASVVTIVGVVLQAAAQNVAMFVIARFTVGVGSAISNGAAPTLLGELLPPHKRARVLGLFFSCYYVGSLASAIVNYGSQNINSTWAWRLPSLLQFVPSLLAVVIVPFVPESPRWLIAHERTEEALEVLLIMQGRGNVDFQKGDEQLNEIRTTIKQEAIEYSRNPWVEIISTRANRKRLAILCTFGPMINMFGNFIISFYLGKILDQAGITSPKTQTQVQVIISCWSFAVAILGSFMLDILGRRLQTFIGVGGMTITLLLIGGLIKTYGESANTSGIYGTIAVIFLFQGFYAFAITPMTSLYPTEVSPFKLRATGIAIFRMLDSGFGLLASFAMAYAMVNLGWKFYFINAAWNFVFLIIAYLTFVETKSLKLEEINAKFEGGEVEAVKAGGVVTELAK
ncbi:general substrate transporter [Emericellopsis atlantica]|uniref:General substrate transporter n=1 Tax=Emericellopsis atlantica TaxID=2614577 RepID=A0A9P8CP62_9HYPO|nr:general substrate transporter [Emericellopsis atlantica]KAG9252436.1 general substrate transporter [Emericellopsis atlantica]